jgi:hypothetical protein
MLIQTLNAELRASHTKINTISEGTKSTTANVPLQRGRAITISISPPSPVSDEPVPEPFPAFEVVLPPPTYEESTTSAPTRKAAPPLPPRGLRTRGSSASISSHRRVSAPPYYQDSPPCARSRSTTLNRDAAAAFSPIDEQTPSPPLTYSVEEDERFLASIEKDAVKDAPLEGLRLKGNSGGTSEKKSGHRRHSSESGVAALAIGPMMLMLGTNMFTPRSE